MTRFSTKKQNSVGIGITTHNRRSTAKKSIRQIFKLTPEAKIIVVDDGSKVPFPNADYRFENPVGIARAKNKCLELLDDCEHIFLFDDDSYPLVRNWEIPYIESPEPHLMRIFEDLAKGPKINDIEKIFEDSHHIAWTGSRGNMLYVHRSVLDIVGGMDPEFGRWGYEHGDWSNRIYAAGLTSWRYADVVGGEKLIYSMDENCAVSRSVDLSLRKKLVQKNKKLFDKQRNSSKYCEYREIYNLVLTSYLTTSPDSQRQKRLKPKKVALEPLLNSLQNCKSVVLNDQLKEEDDQFVRVEFSGNPYKFRWLAQWQYLRAHPEVQFVWCVDGTDVEMLKSPWTEMKKGTLYIGSEENTIGCDWMRRHHPSLKKFIEDNANHQLLNCGLVGGDRETVMKFLHLVIRCFEDFPCELDMGPANYAAFQMENIEWGPKINTVFKAYEYNKTSWWKHK